MEIESIYRRLQKIGEGAYGAVYRAVNSINQQIVALKVSKFDDCDEGLPSTCIRELSILKSFNHSNLVKLLDSQIIRGSESRLQLVFEYVEFDLSKYLKYNQEEGQKGLSQNQSKVFMSLIESIIKKIIMGIHYLHEKGILHRDLKPQNILITKDGKVKIADFGLGRVCSAPGETMSREIQTLWYRAPELLLGSRKYGVGVDIWSIGQGKALFASDSQIGQLLEIFKVLGTPKVSEWPQIIDLQDFKPTFPKFQPSLLSVRKLSMQGREWLFKLLKANPNKRVSISEALNHPYLQKI